MDESIQIHFALAQPFARKQRPAFPFHKVRIRRPGARPVRQARPSARLTVFLVLLANGLFLAFFGRAVYQADNLVHAQENSGNSLQADRFSSTFKVTSAELPVVIDEPAAPKVPVPSSEPPLLTPVTSVAPPPLPAPPALPAPPVVEPPLPLGPVDHVDPLDPDWEPILAYSSTLEPHRGDSPMLRNWKMFELAALFAVVAPSPVLFAGEKEDASKAILERLDKNVKAMKSKVETMETGLADAFKKIGEDMKDLRNDLTKLAGEHLKIDDKVDKLEQSLARLKTDMEDLKKAARPSLSPLDKADLEDLKTRLTSIEQSLAKMQAQTRVSLSPAQPTTGRIMLQNLYNDKLLFKINDREFFVEPQQTRTVEGVPAGPFTYRVFAPQHGWLEPHPRQLAANETFTLTATLP
jgi:regulator of replication initiation timing